MKKNISENTSTIKKAESNPLAPQKLKLLFTVVNRS